MEVIETNYDGYHFRSRLEARFAVFFNYLRTPYEYEKEGYNLDGEFYLPDFFLPDVTLRGIAEHYCTGTEKDVACNAGVWLEVKGKEHTDRESKLCENLGAFTITPVVLIEGMPNLDNVENFYQLWPWWDNGMCFMKCFRCGAIKIEFLESSYSSCKKCGCEEDGMWNHPDILSAIHHAKSARFEFGQSG
uniref:Uncharacterized protein n=1 Tax=viral metagenome TaxID=1070528 RepID=A0A6H1ZZ15_9ZZZZ